MNIFATSYDPKECARVLDDKRVVKMIVETCQILSSAMHILRIEGPPYKPTHMGHPCVLWVASEYDNFRWTVEHLEALINEYKERFPGREHLCERYLPLFKSIEKTNKSFRNILYMWGNDPKNPQKFKNCTPYKHIKDVCMAYKMSLIHKWNNDKRRPRWGGIEKTEEERKLLLNLND